MRLCVLVAGRRGLLGPGRNRDAMYEARAQAHHVAYNNAMLRRDEKGRDEKRRDETREKKKCRRRCRVENTGRKRRTRPAKSHTVLRLVGSNTSMLLGVSPIPSFAQESSFRP